jgi:hypothetical protein
VAKDYSTRDFYVYVHRRATDGTVFYVGKGTGNRAYASQGRSRYWRNIVSKHGYTVQIVQTGMQEWWAFEMERELISSYGRENLCNLTDGGEGCSGVKKSPETIAKQIAIHLGSKRSEESRRRMSEAQKLSQNRPDISGDKNPAKREDVKAKMALADKSWMIGNGNPMKNPDHLKKLTDIMSTSSYKKKMSESILNAFKDESVKARHKASIIQSYKNIDRLEKSQENMRKIASNPEIKKRILESRKKFYETHGKKVRCVENGLIFNNQARAADWLKENVNKKSSPTKISDVIKGKRKTAYGFTWVYA